MRRIRAQQEGRGADWTKIHVPKAVYMVREVNGDPVQELQKAELEVLLDMMRLKGIMNVRGGPHSQVGS